MRAVVQRVSEARVEVAGESVSRIGSGLLVLLGVAKGDTDKDAHFLADKITGLRIFEDEQGKMNLGVLDVGGELLVVSQFTLLGDCRKGRRPGFDRAAEPEEALRLYRVFTERAESKGLSVKTGCFGEMMDVELINHGPVTLLLDSKKEF